MTVKRNIKGQFIEGGVGANTTHGLTKTKLHRTYYGLYNRCTNPKSPKYQSYGGRGIKNLWNSFEDFYSDMCEAYLTALEKYGEEKNITVDRIDNNGNYCKENCRWVSFAEQCRNRRNNTVITFDGISMSIAGWTEKLGKKKWIISQRLRKGWTVKEALTI